MEVFFSIRQNRSVQVTVTEGFSASYHGLVAWRRWRSVFRWALNDQPSSIRIYVKSPRRKVVPGQRCYAPVQLTKISFVQLRIGLPIDRNTKLTEKNDIV